jgi:hypothetical protein
MKHYNFSIAAPGLILAAFCGTTQAASVTPLPQAIANAAAAPNITAVRYYHHRHHHYWRRGGPVGAYWNYYRVDWPGRGNNEESTR